MKIGSLMVKTSVLTETKELTDSDYGRTFFLNAAGGFTVTLPSPRGGASFEFIVKTAPTTDYVITAKASSAIIKGQVITVDANTANDPDFETDGVSNAKFIANVAKIGDSVKFVSDGTYWYATGYCSIWNAITLV